MTPEKLRERRRQRQARIEADKWGSLIEEQHRNRVQVNAEMRRMAMNASPLLSSRVGSLASIGSGPTKRQKFQALALQWLLRILP